MTLENNATPNKIDLLIVHALIVTQDDQRHIIEDGLIAINDGRIQAMGPCKDLMGSYDANEVIDLNGQIVFPGLINTHDHLFQVATKGLGEDMPVQDWVTVVTAPTAASMTPDEIFLFCLNGCLELIHSGVTSVIDLNYMAHSFALHEQNIAAIKQSGLRGRYATHISDFGLEYGIIPELIKPIDWFINEYEKLLEQYPPEDRMAIWVAVGAPWTVTHDGLIKVIDFAKATATPMVMHINENDFDNRTSMERFGKNAVPYLAEVGFLGPEVLAIHCVVMDDEDIGLFLKHDVKISHNPVSNMYLGSGIAPIAKMDQAGIIISLGVDGAGSNNSQDMIETLKMAALSQKVEARDASVVDAQKVLDWATLGGARTLGLANEIGSLEVGKRADMFVIAPNTPKVVPIHDPVATLVYSCGEENVVMTIADGKVLMRDRVIQHIDEQDIVRKCQDVGVALADRCGSNTRLTRRWRAASR